MENNIDFKTVAVLGLTSEQQKIHNNNINKNSSAPLKDVFSPEQLNTIPTSIHGIKLSILDRSDLLLGGIQGKDGAITKDAIDPKYLNATYKVDNNKLMFSLDQNTFVPVRPIHVEFKDHELNQKNLINQAKWRVSEIVHYHNEPQVVEDKMKKLESSFSKLDEDHKRDFIASYSDVIKNEIPKVMQIFPDKLEEQINNITDTISNSNNTVMNVKNQNYLQDQMKYLGFGEELKDVLTAQLSKGKDKFEIQFPVEKENQNAVYSLNFAKSQSNDMYFFNSYKLELTNSKNETMSNMFQVNGFKGITAKEAINVLEGRPVKAVIEFKKKEGEERNEKEVFVQLDKDKLPKEITAETKLPLKYFSQEYGIDTAKILEKAPLKLPNENYREDAIKSLEKGNFVKANFNFKGDDVQGLVTLNAQYKSLNFFDGQGQSLNSKYITAEKIDTKQDVANDNSATLKR